MLSISDAMRRELIILTAIAMWTGCTKETAFEYPDTADMLILNAQIDASEKVHYAFLGISRTDRVERLDSAEVKCYVNGKMVSEAEQVDNAEMDGPGTCYKFKALLSSGDSVRLAASGRGMSAYAAVIVPAQAGSITSLDTVTAGSRMRFRISLKDKEENDNYYRLRLQNKYDLRVYVSGDDNPALYSGSGDVQMSAGDDPILSGGKMGGEGEDNFFGNSSTNSLCIFTDRLFPMGGCVISSSARKAALNAVEISVSFDRMDVVHYAVMHLQTLSKEEYDYLAAQNVLIDSEWDTSDYLEQVSVPNNVKGGLGFVSVFQSASVSLRLPDVTFSFLDGD